MRLLVLGFCFLMACSSPEDAPQAHLAPAQPNGSSPLASTMVAMDAQLHSMLESVLADPNRSWEGRQLHNHQLLNVESTEGSMVNDHFLEQAPLYTLAIDQFNQDPSAKHFNAVVEACLGCHYGTCPGPIERIEKRTWTSTD